MATKEEVLAMLKWKPNPEYVCLDCGNTSDFQAIQADYDLQLECLTCGSKRVTEKQQLRQ
jgi:DNA-directed RNA polymerase subunit RPC12/RpoP